MLGPFRILLPERTLTKAPTIAIIDDDETMRTALYFLVTSLGYNAYRFGSAADFLRSAELHDVSCVISDVRMLVMTGIQLQAHLRGVGYKTPFIFMTAAPEEENVRQQAFKDGAICFLNKPLDEQALIACLEKAIAGRESP
jgi:FixJ family two-component response regulator